MASLNFFSVLIRLRYKFAYAYTIAGVDFFVAADSRTRRHFTKENMVAYTVGTCVYAKSLRALTSSVIRHELKHVEQAKKYGIRFPFMYSNENRLKGYSNNRFERAAKRAERSSTCRLKKETRPMSSDDEDDVIGTLDFKRSFQIDFHTCGPTSAYMVARHFNSRVSYSTVKEELNPNREWGTSIRALINFFRKRKFRVGYRPSMRFKELKRALARGAIVMVHIDGDHLGVVHAVSQEEVYLADPSIWRTWGNRIPKERFFERWGNWGLVISR